MCIEDALAKMTTQYRVLMALVVAALVLPAVGCGDAAMGDSEALTPNSKWAIEFMSASFPQRKPDATPWDIGNPAPDPHVCVSVQSGSAACSSVVLDSWQGDWEEFVPKSYVYTTLDAVRVRLWDDDPFVPDLAGDKTVSLQPHTSTGLTATVTFSSGASVVLRIRPAN